MIDDLFNVGSFAAKALRRSILRYTRRPVEYNLDRLPKPDHYRDMELAFREDYFDPPPFSFKHILSYFKYAALLLLFLAGYTAFGLGVVLTIAGVLVLALPEIFVGRSFLLLFRSQVQLSLAIFFVLLAGLAYIATDTMEYSSLTVFAVGVPTLFLLKRVTYDFLAFCILWLHTHPCLTNQERQESLDTPYPALRLLLPEIVVGVLALGPAYSPFLAQTAVYALLLASLIFGPLRKACRERSQMTWYRFASAMSQLLLEYFTYGRRFSHPLPGVYVHPQGFHVRRRYAVLLLILTLFTFSAGTSFFFPWDTPGFRGQYVAMFSETIYADPNAWNAMKEEMPHLDWSKAPEQGERERMQQRLDNLRELREDATQDDKIAIGIEVKKLSRQMPAGGPELDDIAKAWYGRSTTSWMGMAVRNVFTHPVAVSVSFLFAIANALLLPALFFLATLQRHLLVVGLLREKLEARVATETMCSPWEWFVERLRNSHHSAPDPLNDNSEIREADHLFLGLEAENGFPVLLHRDIVSEHVYITGGTGTGKTSLGILSLLVQLIRTGATDADESEGGTPPIVIIDLKGDYALLHTVREEVRKKAEQEGRTFEDCFRLFTSEKGMPTHYFNPLGDMSHPDRYVADLANLLLDALELNHGPGYGRSFYSRKNYMLLHEVLKADDPATIDELCKRISKNTLRNKDDRHQAFELVATIYGLTEFTQLMPPPNIPESDTISMRTVIEQRQVVYFWLPTVESSIIAREIANLALFSYFSAMRARAKTRVPLRQAYLVVDEFQKLAGDRFSVILEQARGFGLSAILSNQSISDLKTPSFDLRSTVFQNTRLKLYFSFADCREMTDFAKRSGDELAYMRSGDYALAGDEQPDAPFFDQWSHAIKSRVTTNDMLRVTDHPLQAYMDVRSGSGYTQFGGATIPLQMFHPVRWSDFQERRDSLPWPTLEELGITRSVCAAVSPEEVDERAVAQIAQLDERIQAFDDEYPQFRFS